MTILGFLVLLLVTLLSTDTIGSAKVWQLQQGDVCFGTRDNQYGRFTMKNGGLLQGMKLVHKSGYVSCTTTDAYNSNWGCGGYSWPADRISIAITYNKNSRLFPGLLDAYDWRAECWYKLKGYSSTSAELVFKDRAFFKKVVVGEEMRLWYFEDLMDTTEADNHGRACADIYLLIDRESVIEHDVRELERFVGKVNVTEKPQRNEFLNMTNNILKVEEKAINDGDLRKRTIDAVAKFTQKIGDTLRTATLSYSEIGIAVSHHEEPSGVNIIAAEKLKNITIDISSSNTSNDLADYPKSFVSAFLPFDNFPNESLILAIGYRHPKLFPFNKSYAVSFVFSISINNNSRTRMPLVSPIRIDFRRPEQFQSGVVQCVYWRFSDEKEGEFGRWATDGCWKVSEDDHVITCKCSHLTHIALLVVNTKQPVNPTSSIAKILSKISFVGCSMSVVALLLTILLHTVIGGKRVRVQLRSKILVQLCVSWILLMAVFFLSVENKSGNADDLFCRIRSGLIHYFLLVLFMTMGCEAWELQRSVLREQMRPSNRRKDSYETHNDSRFFNACLGASVIFPLIIVVALACKLPWNYGNERYCLVHGVVFNLSVLLPLVALVVFSVVVIFLARRTMVQNSNMSSYSQLKFIVGKLFLLGVTWLIGAFGYGKLALVFQTLFVVLNSTQGVFIFLFVLLERQSRQNLITSLQCCKNKTIQKEKSRNQVPDDDRNTNDEETEFTAETPMMQQAVVTENDDETQKKEDIGKITQSLLHEYNRKPEEMENGKLNELVHRVAKCEGDF